LLRACFDETHIGKSDPITSIAGFIAGKDDWDSVESQWRSLLRDLDVPYVHLAEMRAQKGVFAKCDQLKIKYAENQCAKIITENNLIPVFSSVSRADWNSMSGDNWNIFIARYKNPFHLAFEHVLQNVQFYARARGESVAIVFSEQDELRYTSNEIYNCYANPPVNVELDSLTFANMRKVIPLQTADVIASEINEYWERAEGRPDDLGDWLLKRPLGRRLAAKNNLQLGGLYSSHGLKMAVKKFVACGQV
jgi:Protein of unknown function (DUF3800)